MEAGPCERVEESLKEKKYTERETGRTTAENVQRSATREDGFRGVLSFPGAVRLLPGLPPHSPGPTDRGRRSMVRRKSGW